MLRRNKILLVSIKQDTEIISDITTVFWTQYVPVHIRILDISTNMRSSLMALARVNASAYMVIALREIIITVVRKMDHAIIDMQRMRLWNEWRSMESNSTNT
jgi:hypothetical protein